MTGDDGEGQPSLLLIEPSDVPGTTVRFNFFKDITEAEHEAYSKAVSTIEKSLTGGILVYAEYAQRHLRTVMDQLARTFESRDTSIPRMAALMPQYSTAIDAAILNFCSLLHLHQEQTLSRVTRLHGDESNAHTRTKAAFAESYDGFLGYRVCYTLRNVLIHHSMSCIGKTLRAAETTTASGIIIQQHRVSIPLLRAEFLKGRRMSSAFRSQVTALPDDPEIPELVEEALKGLQQAQARTDFDQHEDLLEDAKTVLALKVEFEGRLGQPAIARVVMRDGRPRTFPHTTVRSDVFAHAGSIVEGASKS